MNTSLRLECQKPHARSDLVLDGHAQLLQPKYGTGSASVHRSWQVTYLENLKRPTHILSKPS